MNFISLRLVQNCVLVWLDSNIDETYNIYQNSINEFQCIVNIVNKFVDTDKCVDFITEIKDEKVFLITSISLGQQIIPNIHDLSQIESIYIFCVSESIQEQLDNNWYKVKGVFTTMNQYVFFFK